MALKRPDKKWPPSWQTPKGVVASALVGAGNTLRAEAVSFVMAGKKTIDGPPELVKLRAAVKDYLAWMRADQYGFGTNYVRVMGIDPGLANVGLMVVDFTSEFLRCVHREKISTLPGDGTAEERLDAIAGRLHAAFADLRPDVVAYENVVHVGHGRGDHNADSIRMLEMCGMIRMCCQLFACTPCYAITTATARKAIFGKTPRGTKREKSDVAARVAELLGIRAKLSADVGEAGAICFAGFNKHMEAK